jgi:TonB family protein
MIGILISGLMVAQATAKPVSGPCIHEATIVSRAQPIYPSQLPRGTKATAIVAVLVGPSGYVEKAWIYRSSGYNVADAAAVKAAQATIYAPKFVDCKATEGEYLFPVEFVPGPPQ